MLSSISALANPTVFQPLPRAIDRTRMVNTTWRWRRYIEDLHVSGPPSMRAHSTCQPPPRWWSMSRTLVLRHSNWGHNRHENNTAFVPALQRFFRAPVSRDLSPISSEANDVFILNSQRAIDRCVSHVSSTTLGLRNVTLPSPPFATPDRSQTRDWPPLLVDTTVLVVHTLIDLTETFLATVLQLLTPLILLDCVLNYIQYCGSINRC